MTVIMGSHGMIRLRRAADESPFVVEVKVSDVNNERNRFSYDYLESLGGGLDSRPDSQGNSSEMSYIPLITGDRVRFLRVDKVVDSKTDEASWVPSSKDQQLAGTPTVDNDFVAYVNVDGMGAIRLYKTFADALNFDRDGAYQLARPTETQYFRVFAGQSDAYRGLAKVLNYEFTTQREAIDITSLGKNYRRFYSNGLLSGQGKITCLWPIRGACQSDVDDDCEDVRYLAELILRLDEGALFNAQLVLGQNYNNRTLGGNLPTALFYECDKCIITNVALSAGVDSVLQTTVEFITTGPFDLRYKALPSYLLVDGVFRATDQLDEALLQENDQAIELFRSEYD